MSGRTEGVLSIHEELPTQGIQSKRPQGPGYRQTDDDVGGEVVKSGDGEGRSTLPPSVLPDISPARGEISRNVGFR